MSNEWPAWEIIKSVIDAEPESIKEDVKITIEENGGLRSVLKVERKYGDSKFTQRIASPKVLLMIASTSLPI